MRRATVTMLAAVVVAAPLAFAPAAASAQLLDFGTGAIDATMSRLDELCGGLMRLFRRCPVSADQHELLKQAHGGDAERQGELGRRIEYAIGGFSGGPRVAIGWYGRAGEGGDPIGGLRYHELRTTGVEAAADEALVARKVKAAAVGGGGSAVLAMVEILLHGRGTERDPEAAMRMLKSAAEAGQPWAQTGMVKLLTKGAPGVPANRGQALDWLRRKAAAGDTLAMFDLASARLAVAFDMGRMRVDDSQRDPVEGYRWMRRAAEAGFGRAQHALIGIFMRGIEDRGRAVVRPDRVQAYMWTTIAARTSSSYDDTSARAELERAMGAAELAEARRLVEAWKPLKPEQAAATSFDPPG